MGNRRITLRNGAQVAIIGGGPAGSFFANFALKLAREAGLDVTVTIFEWRDFTRPDRGGCNMSVGVLAERLMERLDGEGIEVPQRCVQSKIEDYNFFTQDDHLCLHHPKFGHKPRIATVFRGGGPVHSKPTQDISFDNFLLRLVEARGARVIPQEIKDVVLPHRPEDPATIIYGNNEHLSADLVVGAFGVNSQTMENFAKLGFGYTPPRTLRTCIVDSPLGRDIIAERYGKTINVFALGMEEIEFASLTPRGDYLTIAVVGKKDVGTPQLRQFLNHPVVLKVLPQGTEVLKGCCICFPRIPVSAAHQPYDDRLVIVGDAGISRSYKNGIESAFVVAKLAAETAFWHGVSKEAFRKGYYEPARRIYTRDNLYGRLMFRAFDLIASQKRLLSERLGHPKMHKEKWLAERINEGLWNLVTGDAPYRDIFLELFSPRLQFSLLPVTLAGLFKGGLRIKG